MNFSSKPNIYKIRDINLHNFGRKEINLALTEMPGLVALRNEYGDSKPLAGVRISGSLHMTIQTAVLIETLHHLGADIRWCSCNIFSTQDHAAAAIVKAETAAVFAWKGETIEEYWWCLEQALFWPDGSGPQLIVDDGGDMTLLIHEGVDAEKKSEARKNLLRDSKVQDSNTKEGAITEEKITEGSEDEKEMARLISRTLEKIPRRWQEVAEECRGVSEETTTGVARLKALARRGALLFPAVNVNDSVTKSKFDNIYGCKHSLTDGIKRATDVLISGKTTIVCGFGDVGKGCAASLKAEGAKVIVTEIDPICALQACMEGFPVKRLEDVAPMADIIVTATGNKDVVSLDVLMALKNNAIVCNIGHFDNEIALSALENSPGVIKDNIKPCVDRYIRPDGRGVIVLAEGRLVNLGCATGHPSFVMSASFTNQVLAQLELHRRATEGVVVAKKAKVSLGKVNRGDAVKTVAVDGMRNGEMNGGMKSEMNGGMKSEMNGGMEREMNEVKTADVEVLSKELDEKVARLHLSAFGAELTVLSNEQAQYVGVPKNGPFKDDAYRY